MTRVEELRELAEQCRQVANTCVTPGLRESLLALAADYLKRAAEQQQLRGLS